MALSTQIAKNEGTVNVKLKGSLDTQTSPQFQDDLKKFIDDDEIKGMNLDMSELVYISSAGVGSVMWARKTLKRKKAVLNMVNLQPQISQVFDVMKLSSSVNICKNMEEADKYIDHIISEELKRHQ